ncbi:hypothetical protein ACIHCM_29490 [Streptomyces sp. NPDC052023]|uniref:hypothetical protein n=1 Tax=Streptomyces sp. NPDC052023 TaxID=3365681 RepID=UPI0037CF661E
MEPETAAAAITVSDGGDKKLAAVSKGATSLALGWEDTLPTPSVRNDTASYDLGDGQTLTVTALKQASPRTSSSTRSPAATSPTAFRSP